MKINDCVSNYFEYFLYPYSADGTPGYGTVADVLSDVSYYNSGMSSGMLLWYINFTNGSLTCHLLFRTVH